MTLKCILFFLLLSHCLFGQNQTKLGALNDLINKSLEFYRQGQNDSTYHYSKLSYDLAKELKADSLQIKIVRILSTFEPDLETALMYLKDTEALAIKKKEWRTVQHIYYTRGKLYYHRSMDQQALKHYLKLDSLSRERGHDIFLAAMNKVNIVELLNEISTVNDTSFFKQIDRNIAAGLDLVEKGLHVHKDSINFYNAWYLNVPAAILYEKKAYLYAQRHQPKIAITNYKKALANTIFNDTLREDNYLRKSLIYSGLADLYNQQDQKDSTLYYYDKELTEINKTTDTLLQAISNYKIATFYNTNNQPKRALQYINKSQELMALAYFVREENKYDIQDILASIHFKLGNYDKAYEASEKARDLLMGIQKEFNKDNVSELETKYQTEKKEQEIALLESKNKIIEQKRKSQRNLLLGGIGITTVAGLFFFILFRNRKQTAIKLKELDAVKSNFFANISHEFRTPLTLITQPIETTLEEESLSGVKRQQFESAKRNSDRLLSLVNQLLDLSKIDAGQLQLKIQKGNATQLIAALGDSFSYVAAQKDIDYRVDVDQYSEEVYFDKDALQKIVVNLLSNAIKYTPEHGYVMCNVFIKNETLQLFITNSGKGLTDNELQYIFQRFYQTEDQNQGSGIGLALVKELVDLHKGTIQVDSVLNESTVFKVTLPVNKQSFKNEKFIEATVLDEQYLPEINTKYSTINIPEEVVNKERPILLLVEDNDDVRQLLKQTFETTYTIITAVNGEEGIAAAIERVPDLIISDVMMPITNGIALTKHLKHDERTSHIPIILLTAKAGDHNELIGVEVGADDYITKPFNSKILKTKVSKLIENRRLLQERYSQELVLLPTDVPITNIDEKFLEKVQLILDDNLLESSFSASHFCEAVGMSRMQLHRKLKALTGLSTTEFIRAQRLKLATKLIKTTDINISQIGYSVGFNAHSYFAKCFKATYNCTPTEYAKQYRNA